MSAFRKFAFVLIILALPPAISQAALTNLWLLNEGAGTTANNSAAGADGFVNNQAAGGQGVAGDAWVNDTFRGTVFSGNGNDASGAFVSTGNLSAAEMNGNFTWSFWGALSGGTGGNDVILGNRFGGPGWAKFTQTNFEWQPSGGGTGNTNIADIPTDGGWRHHTIVKNGNNFQYYLDGVAGASANFTGTFSGANPFFIGGDSGGERPGSRISDVAIFNEALTQNQILNIRNGDFTAFGVGSAPAVSIAVATGQQSSGVFPVSNDDLLTGLTAVVTGTPVQARESTSGNVGVLTNGNFGTADKNGAPGEIVTIETGTILTYLLTGSPHGFTIDQINTYSGWNDGGRDEQDYVVQFAFADDPSTFVSVGDVSFNPGGTNPSNLFVQLTNPLGGPLAQNVTGIRFIFDTLENGYVGFREIDVFGAAVPEPTTAGLALIALSLLGKRRRRA
ncbi:MAG: LamG-like jellyroll fold domain-containing protein [Phycisphaeraceae bacterium]